jgi:16S rRNA (adenine1518-N6/adenine1519-N6)-dimethyltransferase
MKNSKITPKHHLGQNFLQDDEVLKKIIDAAELDSDDVVLEVGPGLGVLTKELIKKVKHVIAVEKDERLFSDLSRLRQDGLTLINQDVLRFNLPENIKGPYKVVANIPYYLTSKLFQYFLEQKDKPELLILMVQKEVGERVVAKPGELSILGISVQIYADVEIVSYVDKKSFWPIPEVDSVILKINPKEKYPEIKDKKLFFRIIKTAFAGKRKQLKNTIKDIESLKRSGIDPCLRPQDVNLEQWIELYKQMDLQRS